MSTLFTSTDDQATPLPLDDILLLLRQYRLPIGDESACQNRVETILTRRGVTFLREHDLGAGRGRIDFLLPVQRVGLELKVKGSPAAVARQLQQYATSPEIDQLVLLTGRIRLASVPRVLHGKPVRVVSLWQGVL